MIHRSRIGFNVLTCDSSACMMRIAILPEMLYPEDWSVLELKRRAFHFCSHRCQMRFEAERESEGTRRVQKDAATLITNITRS